MHRSRIKIVRNSKILNHPVHDHFCRESVLLLLSSNIQTPRLECYKAINLFCCWPMRILCLLCCFCKSVQGESGVFLRRKRGYAIQWSCSLSERAQIYSRYFLRGGACSTRSLAICCHPNQCRPDSKANITIVPVQNKARNEAFTTPVLDKMSRFELPGFQKGAKKALSYLKNKIKTDFHSQRLRYR